MKKQPAPPHPGTILRDNFLPALGLTQGQAAAQLGVIRSTLARLLHGHTDVSVEMAIRLELWLSPARGGDTALEWLHRQAEYDLWQARQRPAPKVQPAPAIMDDQLIEANR